MTDVERIEQLEIQLNAMEDFVCTFLALALISSTMSKDGLLSDDIYGLINDFAISRAKDGKTDGLRLAERLRGMVITDRVGSVDRHKNL